MFFLVAIVTLLNEAWCWKEKTLEIEIVDRDLEDVTFTQSGYILSCSLSHDITLVSGVCLHLELAWFLCEIY